MATEKRLDETVPGGRYLNTDGQLVDANGEALEGSDGGGGEGEGGTIDATESARELAAEAGLDLASVEGTGAGGRITKGDVEDAIAAADEG